jgi:hypothetical protein
MIIFRPVVKFFLIVLPFSCSANAQELKTGRTFHIEVQVTAPDAIRAVFESSLLRELRKRPDISIVGSRPDYILSLVCAGSSTVSCSSVGMKTLDIWLDEVPKMCGDVKNYGFWFVLTTVAKTGGGLSHQAVLTGSVSDLESLSSRIAASFESDTLEGARKLDAEVQRGVKASQQPPK